MIVNRVSSLSSLSVGLFSVQPLPSQTPGVYTIGSGFGVMIGLKETIAFASVLGSGVSFAKGFGSTVGFAITVGVGVAVGVGVSVGDGLDIGVTTTVVAGSAVSTGVAVGVLVLCTMVI